MSLTIKQQITVGMSRLGAKMCKGWYSQLYIAIATLISYTMKQYRVCCYAQFHCPGWQIQSSYIAIVVYSYIIKACMHACNQLQCIFSYAKLLPIYSCMHGCICRSMHIAIVVSPVHTPVQMIMHACMISTCMNMKWARSFETKGSVVAFVVITSYTEGLIALHSVADPASAVYK